MTSGISDVISGLNQGASSGALKKNASVGKDEFLMMLVTQLKNQDPLDPMKNEDFAVNLAQFSQLEQLMEINKNLGSSGNDPASLASLLGKKVSYESNELSVEEGQANSISLEIPGAIKESEVKIYSLDGEVIKTINAGAMAGGRHQIDLKELDIPDGQYLVEVIGHGFSGQSASLAFSQIGTVTGIMPGDDPTLLVGEREVKLSEVGMFGA